MTMTKKANLYIISGPSGTGKTSLVATLIKKSPKLAVSVSYTTRKKRPREINGKHYHFISYEKFQKMITNEQFLEYTTIHKQLYGTSKTWVNHRLKMGMNTILEIDWQGAKQIRQYFKNAISIFILPPSYQALEQRLRKRSQNKELEIYQRIKSARKEIDHCHEFDYLMVNDNFTHSVEELMRIINLFSKTDHDNTKSHYLNQLIKRLQQGFSHDISSK